MYKLYSFNIHEDPVTSGLSDTRTVLLPLDSPSEYKHAMFSRPLLDPTIPSTVSASSF